MTPTLPLLVGSERRCAAAPPTSPTSRSSGTPPLARAVAVKQGVDLDKVFETSTTGTQCQQVAQQVAHP